MLKGGNEEMNEKDFYNKVGQVNGWDFSQVQVTTEAVAWNFYEEVLKRGRSSDILLDIGTGGGENLLNIASSFHSLVGIDVSSGMMETARANLNHSNVSNVSLTQMSSEKLTFPTESFDLITSCHAPFSAREVVNVLKKGGLFLTQQVSEFDKLNLKAAFGRGQSFGEKEGSLKERYINELEEAGFSDVQSTEYNATEYYHRPEDLIFLLTHTPIIPEFGERENDFDILSAFIQENKTEIGIRTNAKRFMIVAQK